MASSYRKTGDLVDGKNLTIEQTLITHLPNGRERVEHRPQVKLEVIHFEQRAQARITGIDKGHLQDIKHALENGEVLPSIVLIQRDNGEQQLIMSEGIHRYTAASELGMKYLPAFVCTDVTNDESVYLGGLFNASNGKPSSAAERRRAIAAALRTDPPPTDDRLARDFGVDRGTVNRIRREGDALSRLDRMGISSTDLANSHLEALSRLDLDAPFRAMAELILDSGMSSSAAKTLVGEVVKLPSEAEQLDKIRAYRHEIGPDIAAKEAGRVSTGSPISDLRRMITTISKLIEKFPRHEQWAPHDAEAAAELAPRLSAVLTFLGAAHEVMVSDD